MRKLILLLILLFTAINVNAAVTITTGTPAVINTTTNASTYAFASFTPTTNAILVVVAYGSSEADAGKITNTSGTALTWILKTSLVYNTSDKLYVFWAKTPATTAASVYTVDFAADNAAGCLAALYTITGADNLTNDPIKQIVTNTASSTNATLTFATALTTTNGYIIAWGGQLGTSANSTVPSGTAPTWVEDNDVGYTTTANNFSTAHANSGGTGTTYTFTNLTTVWGAVGLEIYVAGAGPKPNYKKMVTIG